MLSLGLWLSGSFYPFLKTEEKAKYGGKHIVNTLQWFNIGEKVLRCLQILVILGYENFCLLIFFWN